MTDDVLLDVLFRINDNILGLDNNFTVTYVNQTFADLLGLKVLDMLGKNLWALLPKAVGTVAFNEINEAMAKKQARHFEWVGPYSNTFLETTIFPSEKGITILSRDITERKQAQEELRKTEHRFRIALKDSPITLIELDCNLRFKWIYNPLIARSEKKLWAKKLAKQAQLKT
jgi:PAS domain S-box-containing protein